MALEDVLAREENPERKQLITEAWPLMPEKYQQALTDGKLEVGVCCIATHSGGTVLKKVNLVKSLTKETVWDKWIGVWRE